MNKEELFIYAPVAIPTLNRYEHFKRCLESLERCTGAEKTEVYIGLDYPPSDRYVEGWKKIDEFLSEKEKDHQFKSLFVRRRDRNYGIGNSNSNASLLLNEIRQYSDRFILTEDDNDFSPNFLEYINWGLEYFKDDPTIFAVCGFKNLDTHDINNNVYRLNTIFCAWGYGTWFSKKEKYDRLKNHDLLRSIVNKASFKDVCSSKILTMSSLVFQIAMNTFHGDLIISLLPEDEKWCIFPKVNKVRNWGWDGSGSHGGSPDAFKKYSTVTIDSNVQFTPIIVEDLYNPVVFDRFKKQYKTPIIAYIRSAIVFLTYKISGFIPVANKKSKWCKVRFLKVR